MKVKKVPTRLCLGCREAKPKKELLRIVRTPEGAITPDPSGKQNGRGAYICNDIGCFNAAVKAKSFAKAFKGEVDAETVKAIKISLFGEDL